MELGPPEAPRPRVEPILPMVNLVFLLLIFLLLATTLAPPAPARVTLPEAPGSEPLAPQVRRLSLDGQGRLAYGNARGEAALEALRADGAGPVALHAERTAPAEALARVLGALGDVPVLLVVEAVP